MHARHIVPICMSIAVLASCEPPNTVVPGAPTRSATVVVPPKFNEELATVQAQVVQGTVRLGGPVARAIVAAIDGEGALLAGPVSTNEWGAYRLSVAGLPDDFLLVAQDGSVGQTPLHGLLAARVRHLSAANNNVVIGVPSSIAAIVAVQDGRPPEHLALLASAMLGLPPNLGLRTADGLFDGKRLMADAAAAGGFESYFSTLAKSIDAPIGAFAKYRFRPGRGLTLKSVGEKIALGLAGKLGGVAGQKLLNILQIGSSQEIIGELNDIHQNLEQIKAQLDYLEQDLDEKLTKQAYVTSAGQVSNIISHCDTINQNILSLAENAANADTQSPPPPNPVVDQKSPYLPGPKMTGMNLLGLTLAAPWHVTQSAYLDPSSPEGIVDEIYNYLDAPGALMTWHNAMMGNGLPGVSGMIKTYNQAVGSHDLMSTPASLIGWPANTDSTLATSEKIDSWWNIVDAYQANLVQLIAMERVANKFTSAPQVLNDWANNRVQQFETLRGGGIPSFTLDLTAANLKVFTANNAQWIPDGLFVVRGSDVFWYVHHNQQNLYQMGVGGAFGYFTETVNDLGMKYNLSFQTPPTYDEFMGIVTWNAARRATLRQVGIFPTPGSMMWLSNSQDMTGCDNNESLYSKVDEGLTIPCEWTPSAYVIQYAYFGGLTTPFFDP